MQSHLNAFMAKHYHANRICYPVFHVIYSHVEKLDNIYDWHDNVNRICYPVFHVIYSHVAFLLLSITVKHTGPHSKYVICS